MNEIDLAASTQLLAVFEVADAQAQRQSGSREDGADAIGRQPFVCRECAIKTGDPMLIKGRQAHGTHRLRDGIHRHGETAARGVVKELLRPATGSSRAIAPLLSSGWRRPILPSRCTTLLADLRAEAPVVRRMTGPARDHAARSRGRGTRCMRISPALTQFCPHGVVGEDIGATGMAMLQPAAAIRRS